MPGVTGLTQGAEKREEINSTLSLKRAETGWPDVDTEERDSPETGESGSWGRWYVFVIPALRRWRQAVLDFKLSILSYIESSRLPKGS